MEASSRDLLKAAVQARLDDGWSFLGGVAIAIDPGSPFPMIYAQAMARDHITIDDEVVERAGELIGSSIAE